MDETQIHHLSTSHIEPTLLGYFKNAHHISNFSKKILWINSNKLWTYSWPQSEYVKALLWLNTHSSNKFFKIFSKCIHSFKSSASSVFSWFSQELFTSWKSIPQETMKIFEVGFPKSKFSSDFPWKCYFLKFIFQRNSSSFSRIKVDFQIFQKQYSQDFNFLSFEFLSSKSFLMNFNRFPKKILKVRASW